MNHCIFVVDCPPTYKRASKNSPKICLDTFCPVPFTMELYQCIEHCTNLTQCHLFNYLNVGKEPQCFLYGFDEEEGRNFDSLCEQKLGSTCCEKGTFI